MSAAEATELNWTTILVGKIERSFSIDPKDVLNLEFHLMQATEIIKRNDLFLRNSGVMVDKVYDYIKMVNLSIQNFKQSQRWTRVGYSGFFGAAVLTLN